MAFFLFQQMNQLPQQNHKQIDISGSKDIQTTESKMDPLSSSIPVMRSPADIMAKGPNGDNLAAGAVQAHPVDRMQRGKKPGNNIRFLSTSRPSC